MINRWVGYNEGGNETHTKDLLIKFNDVGHAMSVITTKGDSLSNLANVKCYFINSPKGYYSYGLSGIFNAFLFDIKCFVKFIELYLKGQRFDIISVHFSLESLVARLIKLVFGIPYVFVLAGDTPLELICAKRADEKVQISEFMNKQCLKFGYSAHVIPKGFDLARYSPDVNADDLKHNLGLEGKKIVLTVCRLDPRKNLSNLIDAADIIVNKLHRSDIVFLIVGDGVEKAKLEKEVLECKLQDFVEFIGNVPNLSEDHPKYYSMSDLFVLPTLYEGFGWVYLEAMASGVPILTTNVGSNSEVVGDVGVLVPPHDANILSNEIIKISDDDKLRESLKQSGLSKSKNYSWEQIFPKYEKVYQDASLLKCNFICRLKIILETLWDFWLIVASLLRDNVVFNNVSSIWNGKGQSGANDTSKNIYVVFNSQVSAKSMGGGDKIVLNISNQLIKQGDYCVSYVGCPEGKVMVATNLPQTAFFYINNFSVGKSWFVFTYFARILFSLNILKIPVKQNSILYSASDFLPDTVPCFLYKLIKPQTKWMANLFLKARNPFKNEVDFNISTLFYFLSQQMSILFFKLNVDSVFVLCEDDKRYLVSKNIDKSKIFVISGGVDTEEIAKIPKTQYKIYDACYVGRFHYQKGIDDLVYVWNKVVKQFPNAKLAVIGWGDESEKQKLQNSKNIEILGFLDGAEKFKIMKSSKMLLFPSNFESWGVSVAEAICCGIPVVAYDLEVLTKTFLKGVVWVPKFDKEIYYNKVLELLQNADKRAQIVNLATEFSKTMDWSYTVQLFKKVLEGI